MSKLKYIQDRFATDIGAPDIIIRVPGRANIIGEHIDYCGGSVLPFAIEQSMYFVARRRSDNIINVKALDVDEEQDFLIGVESDHSGWRSYFSQAIRIISADYSIRGVDIYFASDIPVGAGVSSSSAICVGIIHIIDRLYNLGLTKNKMVDIASQAEHGIGIRGGIMDQYTILHGQKDNALLIDCNTGTHSLVDISSNPYKWILLNTNVKHELANTPYNNRRGQVEEALEIINERIQSRKTFSQVSNTDIAVLYDKPLLQKRIKHVYTEILRVRQAVNCITDNNYSALGTLLNQSHKSLSEDYEVSCKELDFVCNELSSDSQVLGCRMMGGGFGGSVIALVQDGFDSLTIEKSYHEKFGLQLDVISVSPSDGVDII